MNPLTQPNNLDSSSGFMPNHAQPPEIPKDVQKKLKKLKQKLDRFKKEILKKHRKHIVAITLLPKRQKQPLPPGVSEKKEKENPDEIEVLAVVRYQKNKKQSFMDFIKKIEDDLKKVAKPIDSNIVTRSIDVEELKESCYDGKYEILRQLAMSAPIYDPKDLLAAVKISEVHKSMTIQKFEKYVVSYVAAGSLFRGDKKSNDIDVYVIIDDTDVKKMSRIELKDKLRSIIVSMGFDAARITGVNKQFHVQTYILTDFWDSVKDAHPVIFTFLRDGVPLYDRSVFMPWKLLLKMGRIKPSSESIDMHMDLGEKLLDRTKTKLISIVSEDIYYAILNPSQAALMLYGLAPPTPKETIQLMSDIFVKKEKMFEQKYVDMLAKVREFYKKIEHRKIKEVKGSEIDELLENANAYLKRIKKLFKQIEAKTEKQTYDETLESATNIVREVLEVYGRKPSKNLEKDFEKFVKEEKFPTKLCKNFEELINSKKDKKLTKAEIEKVKKEGRIFVKSIIEIIQRKKGVDLAQAKIRVKYGDKFGEVTFFDDEIFIQKEVGVKTKEVMKAKISSKGRILKPTKSNIAELEKKLENAKTFEKAELTPQMIDDLKKVFGKEFHILIN